MLRFLCALGFFSAGLGLGLRAVWPGLGLLGWCRESAHPQDLFHSFPALPVMRTTAAH